MSYPTHLIKVNSRYYYKIKVPVDLQHYFPRLFVKKSLKTSDLREAKTMLAAMEYSTHRSFTLLRTGMLPPDIIVQMVAELMPSKGCSGSMVCKEAQADKGMVLSKAIQQYVADKQVEWTEKTKMEVNSVFRLLQDILGDVDVCSITKPDVVELRANLLKLPANLYKKYPGKTIKQILEHDNLEPMSLKSVNKHVSRLGALLRYCVDEGIIASNAAFGLKISEKKRADEERNAYGVNEIKNLMRFLPSEISKPERYWIPLIGLYSGMRLNEICQLYVADIHKVDGVWCFSVNGAGDKRLKNIASERMIPVHPALLEAGFLQYVEGVRIANMPRLWMNLTYMEIHGYSNAFGKWYQRFNRNRVTDDPKKVFHSMRHTVADTLKQAGVQEVVIAEIMGHANDSMTTGRYGKRYQPKVLQEALMQLDYGIDIPVWEES